MQMNETKAWETQTSRAGTAKTQKGKTGVQRNYKDTVFRMIFREKENLLSLYNALNGTAYEETDALEITTLENAVYMNYKNDISFVFDFELLLYEHQSTCNPNMPLRDLIYVTRVLQNRIKDENLYSKSLIRIPTPRFVVFYNGTDFQPEQQVLYLSDAFEKKQDDPALELSVIVYNINLGYNHELLDACRLLKEYAQYVAQVRAYAEKLPLSEAVEKAVDDCIKNDILAKFLAKNRAEAIAVSIFEYDEEKHMKSERKEWREIGYREGREDGLAVGREEGIVTGREEGSDTLARLLQSLTAAGKSEEIDRVLHDSNYRKQLLSDYFQKENT
jgi:hypothetical protein